MRKLNAISFSIIFSALTACGNDPDFGLAIALTIDSSAISSEKRASVRILDLEASGAEQFSATLSTINGLHVIERTIYRPIESTGSLTIAITARNMEGAFVGFGASSQNLIPAKTVNLTVRLSSSRPEDQDMNVLRDMSTLDLTVGPKLIADLAESDSGGMDSSTFDLNTAVDLISPDLTPPFSPGPSCAGLPAACGGTTSCCDSPIVVGGSFFRSHDNATDGTYADASAPATLADYRLDRFEVTVGRFRKFLDAGKGTQLDPPSAGAGAHSSIVNSGWDATFTTSLEANRAAVDAALKCHASLATWTDSSGANEEKPINCVTWFEALAFCAWDGGFLPTEAEWNYAASGGAEHRAYPWSNPADDLFIDNSFAVYACGGGTCTGVDNIGPVGSRSPKGDGKFHQADLAGSVWEWTLDYYNAAYVTPCDNCANLASGTTRTKRGGGFTNFAVNLRAANRDFDSGRDHRTGFRCGRPK